MLLANWQIQERLMQVMVKVQASFDNMVFWKKFFAQMLVVVVIVSVCKTAAPRDWPSSGGCATKM